VTSLLELAAVVLAVVGAGVVAVALVPGLVGIGVGLLVSALVAGAASAILQLLAGT
jgi:hypothetical protein